MVRQRRNHDRRKIHHARIAVLRLPAIGGLVGKVTVWTSDAPIDERIELLRQRISDLEGEVSELRDEVRTANAATGKAIANLEASIQQETEALRALLEEERRAAARIDSRGLPLIAAGVFLSGVPDDLARLPWHLGLAVLGLGLLVLVIVAGPLVRRTAKPLGRWLGGADEAAA